MIIMRLKSFKNGWPNGTGIVKLMNLWPKQRVAIARV